MMISKIKYFGMMVALLLTALSFNACSSDDEEEEDIGTYLKGKWYSYKAVISRPDGKVEVEVSKTGQFSQIYYEAVFKDGGKVDCSYYKVGESGLSSWETETNSYSLNGNTVKLYDENESIDFFYNPKEKNAYMRVAANVAGVGYTSIFIYFKK